MRLALLGYPVAHSLSPSLYREILGDRLTSYDLLELRNPGEIPSLAELSRSFDGLSITSPHKSHFFPQLVVDSQLVRELRAVNTIAFRGGAFYGTNTDVIAVEEILTRLRDTHGELDLIVLGDGVMARLTTAIADSLNISFRQFARRRGDDLQNLDLSSETPNQTVIVNACARDFVFRGQLHPNSIFWDYNYSFKPHQNTLPFKVMSYVDGQEMLRLQALAAVKFWSAT